MLWFLVGFGLLVTAFAVRDLLRGPDPTAQPGLRQGVPRGRDHTDWARAWDGLNGGGNAGSHGGGADTL